MSVSGASGIGGPSWDDAAIGHDEEPAGEAAAATSEPTTTAPRAPAPGGDRAAIALRQQLEGMVKGGEAWLPDWLKWVDSDSDVHALGSKVIQDGKISNDEVVSLVRQAMDWGEMQPAEREGLAMILKTYPEAFEASGRQALADLLGVANPLPGAPTTGPTGPTGPDSGAGESYDVGLAGADGKRFEISTGGFPVVAGETQGPPGMHGEGAERIYRAGQAMVEAPAGVLKGLPAEVQESLLENSVAYYEHALEEVQGSPVSPMDAHKVRSGAAATLTALVEGGATAEIREAAAQKLIALGQKEPVEGLRANIYLNLQNVEGSLGGATKAELGKLKELVLPSKPPYDAWFKSGDETFEVVHYAHHECWEHATDPITRYQREGMTVAEEGTNERGEKFWVMEGEIDGGNGDKQKTRIRIIQSHDEFCRDLDDPNVHAVIYSGHSNLGGNISEAIRQGPEENGKKLLSFQVCRGQQNLYEVANKYPNAHLSTSDDPSYFANMMDLAIGTIKGVARRDTYDGINEGTRMSYRAESVENYIRPNELRRYEFSDLDFDGQPEVGLDARDRFFDVIQREPPETSTDLQPRAVDAPADQLDATAVMNGANFARTLVTYHVEHGPGDSPLKRLEGDRIEAAGFFEGGPDDDLVRIEETRGDDGKPVYNVSVNKSLEGQSAYAIGGLIQYELTRHFAEKDGSFSADEKARALLMTGTYLSYMYCTQRESESIMRGIGEMAGVPDLTFRTVYAAIDSDGHGYVTDKQVEALRERVDIR